MLEIGQVLPDVGAQDQNGVFVSLNQFIGNPLVVYFYPKDDTPGCTAQACSLRDYYDVLLSQKIQIIGVSADEVKSHVKFSTKYQLPFPLLADTEKSIIQAFGVWGPKKFMGREYDGIHRTTFVFDEKGTLSTRISKPDTKNHAQEILNIFENNK